MDESRENAVDRRTSYREAGLEAVAAKVRNALDTGDLEAFGELLDPDVHWGPPGSRRPPCTNKKQVVDWYQRGRQAGGTARVRDVVVHEGRLLVSMEVRGTEEARERGGTALRWQVLTVRDGRVVDIVGFPDRTEAVAYAERA